MKCWPEPCTSLKDMFNFKNLSRQMDFHGNTDVLKICVAGIKSYPSLLCGVMLLLFVKVKNTQMLLLLQGISWLSKTGILNILCSWFLSPDSYMYGLSVICRIKICTGVTTLIVSLCWAKMSSINIASRYLTSVELFFSFILFSNLYECR